MPDLTHYDERGWHPEGAISDCPQCITAKEDQR